MNDQYYRKRYCLYCGKEIKEGAGFCSQCGRDLSGLESENSIELGKTHKSKKNLLWGFIIVALIVILILQNLLIVPLFRGEEVNSYSYHGYETPEKVMEAFVKELSRNNLEEAMSLTACNKMAENFKFDSYMDYSQSWIPSSSYSFPSTTQLFQNVNEESFSIQADGKYLEGIPIVAENAESISSELESACDLEQLDTLQIQRMDYSNPEQQNEETWAGQTEWLGAEEIREYTILYNYGGKSYGGGVHLIRYGGMWYIQDLVAVLANQDASGYLQKMSEEEYTQFAGI